MIYPGGRNQDSDRDDGIADIDDLVKELESKFSGW